MTWHVALLLAGVLDLDALLEQVVEERHAGFRVELRAFRAGVRVREDDDLGHG